MTTISTNPFNGDSSDEVLRGIAGEENSIAGNDGDDVIVGRGKSDLLLGGKGNDTVKGGNGHDELFGGAGDDEVYGGNGGDRLSGDKGNDSLYGGNGNDTFVINANLAGDSHDTIMDFDVDRALRKMTFNDSIEIKNVGGQVFCFQETSDGDVELTIDGDVVATIKGSEGALSASDVLAATDFVGGSPSSVKLLDANGAPINFTISGTQGDDEIVGQPGIENTIAGNAGNDDLIGRGKSDFLLGGKGDDTLTGANGNDTLYGGADDDELSGGNGADLLNGDKGMDFLIGGNGADIFEFTTSAIGTGVDTIADYDATEGDAITMKNGNVVDFSTAQNGADTEIFYDGDLIGIALNTTAGDLVFI